MGVFPTTNLQPSYADRFDDSVKKGIIAVYFSPGEDCSKQIEYYISKTKKTLDICVYSLSDDKIRDQVLEALKRKVKIRIITDVQQAAQSVSDDEFYERAGIPVIRYRDKGFMHNKFAIFDGEVMVTGSYNWTKHAHENDENMVVISDKKCIKMFQDRFELLWNNTNANRNPKK
jgi:phosphatidylserine/phosphatidylglycerophosphate/cardiolipin synthase-like enzyme